MFLAAAAGLCSLTAAEAGGEIPADNECRVQIPLDGDSSRVVEFSEPRPDRVDYSVHLWCARHHVHDTNACNELRNFFLNQCFPTYLNDFHGPIYTIIFNDNKYNMQMKKLDSHMNETVDRFCSGYTPSIDPASPECVMMKSTLMSDESFLLSAEVDILSSSSADPAAASSSSLLENLYKRALTDPSDVRDHIEDHARLARECEVVLEVGVRDMVSTWGMLWGLAHNEKTVKKYIGVDLSFPTGVTWRHFLLSCETAHVDCVFLDQNDMSLVPADIGPVDMLFIDALHTYSHVMYELTTFHNQVRKYIALHDTSAPWGDVDEPYSGDYSEYPAWIDKTKRGVFTAVLDFLAMHPTEWVMTFRKKNSNGYTLLERVQNF